MHILRGLAPVTCEGILTVTNGFNLSDTLQQALVPALGRAGTIAETRLMKGR